MSILENEIQEYKKIIEKSGLFDGKYYLRYYRKARLASEISIDYFIKFGLDKDHKPNKHFDPVWYREYNEDVKKDGIYPLLHYIRFGEQENRLINESEKNEYKKLKNSTSFDEAFYKNNYEDLKIQGAEFDCLLHYIRYGKEENRLAIAPVIPVKKKVIVQKKRSVYEIIEESGLFSENYYLENYLDIKATGINPIKHYIKSGFKEGRNPNSYFDSNYYLSKNKDVRKSGINPLLHYILYGKEEGRKTEEQASYNFKYNDYIKLRDIKSDINVAVIVHIYYVELWEEILEKLKDIKHDYTLYITTTESLYSEVSNLKMPDVRVKIYKYKNIGMDIYPFVQVLKSLSEDKVDIFCKLHTKKGNDNTGKVWKETLLKHTIGNDKIFSGIARAFSEDENLKLVGSAYFYKNIKYLIGNNRQKLEEAILDMDLNENIKTTGFFAGSMFWGRVEDYKILWEYITDEKFTHEQNISNSDGSFAHVLERLVGLVHKGDKRVGLVYKGNHENDYFLEKQIDNSGMNKNIGDSVFQINNIEYDYGLLKNFRFFNIDKYKKYFPHLNGHGIDSVYHYLTIGKFFYNSDLSTDILNLFDYGGRKDKRVLPLIHLALNGALYEKDLSANRDLNYEFSRLKVAINEMHLIDWDIEHKKPKNRSLVSIVIPVYGQAELTDSCLMSIISTDAGVDYEIIVINNGQDKSDVSALDKWNKYSNIKIIHNEENLNFALGCNFGFSRSIGEKVVFLNNDTTVTDYWLSNLILPLEDQNVSITQPKLLYPDGDLQCMGLVFSNRSKLAYPLYQNKEIPEKILNVNRMFNAVTGACLAVKAEDFAIVKGFDTHYINGQEDVDFCLKLNRLKNTKAMYVANSTVYHYEGKSKGRGKFVVNNRRHFIEKWGESIIEDDMQHYAMDGCVVSQWNLDSQVFKDMNLENYIPVLDFVERGVENQLLVETAENFYINGSIPLENNKKTILISSHTVGKQIFGGERSFLDMVKAIDKSKYNLIITIPSLNNREYVEILSENSSAIYILNYRVWNFKGVNNQLVKLLENIIISNSVDLVYTNTIMCKESLVAAQNLNITKAIHVRELIDRDEHLINAISQNSKSILSEIVSTSDYLFVNSKITNDMFDSNNKGIIYNQIETQLYKNIENVIDESKIKFTMISSNIPKKGIYDFLELAKLSKHIMNAHFILIGPENRFIEKLQESIFRENLTNITIAGYYDDPIEAIKESNVVLSLSNFAESFGRTVGEASAGGRPVISYRYGAIPELIEHGENGYLVDYKDINDIVKYIEIFCKDPNKINEMGEKGRAIIEKISSPAIYTSTLNHLLEDSFKVHNFVEDIKLTIVIPIYNAYNEVINCIDSVLNTITDLSIKVLLIDDCSPDKRIKPMLKKYNELKNVEVLYNSKNIGYTNTVNKGIKLSKSQDIILLNSDTITTFNWIEDLRKVAYSDKKIGTVTAMSDNAGAFSFPIQSVPNPKPIKMQYNNYANIILRKSHTVLPVEVPTGSGFCFYIKRELIDSIGSFDHKAFPRGYGEENDFCMRAVANGWKNVIAPNSFIFHIRTASFGNEKEKLVKEGVATVIQRYPEYNQVVQKAFSSQGMKELRISIKTVVNNL